MKDFAPLSALALALLCACQATPTVPHGQRIGQEIQPQQSVRFSVVDASPAKFFDKTVLVEANVKAVCKKKGCWMQVEDQGRTAMVRWESGCGGQYKFPMAAVGKRVLIQGSFYPKATPTEGKEYVYDDGADGDINVGPPVENYEFKASSVIIIDS